MRDVLVIEDENDVRELILLQLKRHGFEARGVSTAAEAQIELSKSQPELMITDWMLPGDSGVQIIKKVRAEKFLFPILMLTAKSLPSDIVLALDSGADDYLVKPFATEVLIARVKALLRRSMPMAAQTDKQVQILNIGDIQIDCIGHRATIHGQDLPLTVSEFKLLVAFANAQGKVLTRESLISQVQGEGVSVIGRTVDTHVFGLRKKLGVTAELIETVRGVGYRVKDQQDEGVE